MIEEVLSQLVPTGTLRAGVNMANKLLVTQGLPNIPGARILDGQFTAVQQAVGTAKANDAAAVLCQTSLRNRRSVGWWPD